MYLKFVDNCILFDFQLSRDVDLAFHTGTGSYTVLGASSLPNTKQDI